MAEHNDRSAESLDALAKTIWLAGFERAFSRTPTDPWENQAESAKAPHIFVARKIVESGLVTFPVAQAVPEPQAWCQPMDCGKHTPRKFFLYFDDPDHGNAVFEDEHEARAAFERASTAWNCYLFGALPLAAQPPAAPVEDDELIGLNARLSDALAEIRLLKTEILHRGSSAATGDAKRHPAGCFCDRCQGRPLSRSRPSAGNADVREALELAEDMLSRAPYSTRIWPNGMHPQTGINKIRDAISALNEPQTVSKPEGGK